MLTLAENSGTWVPNVQTRVDISRVVHVQYQPTGYLYCTRR
jgi:hypothetical protein